MCGINGFLFRNIISNPEYRIEKMNASLAHRGPDAEGIFVSSEKRVYLGQRRLAIVDLDARSNQPFSLDNEKAVITFNGEVYNYRDLREKLHYSFSTQSDTEVLLAGIYNKGIEWLRNCNGMFAFAIYDSERRIVTLARDRLGIKPLYYYKDDDVFVFSSEIKGILNSGLVDAVFNEDVIDEYLGNRYIREPYTFFKEIYQLPAGCYMTVTEDLEIDVKRYWNLPKEFNMSNFYDESIVYNGFKKEIDKAIKRRMVADVNVGTYLSGGVDSSIITAVTSINSKIPLNTYTIGFPELNEFEYARMVADRYGTNHHEIVMEDKSYFDMLEEIIKYKDSPLGVPNEIPLAQMSKKLKQDITVVLSGEGADELLGGYGRIFRSPFDYCNVDKSSRRSFYEYFIEKYEYVPRIIRDKYLNVGKPLREEFDNMIKNQFEGRDNEENVFRFFHNYHVKGLLQRVDITTMYASVEARVPFLDHELVEYCYTHVPYKLKLKWNSDEEMKLARNKSASWYSEILDKPKYLMRRYALELLPEIIVTRKKVGFPVPLDDWFPKMEKISMNLLQEINWINKNIIIELYKDCKNSERAGQILWMFINVELFRRLYFNRNWRY